MLYLMGRSLWFGAVSSQRAFVGVVSVRDEGVTPSLPSFAPNSILALEIELFVASPLMPSFAGTGAMEEESTAAIVAALLRCDEGCGIAQPGLCPPCFQYVGCGLFPLGSDPPLVAAPDFAFLVSFDGLSHVTDFLGSVVFAGNKRDRQSERQLGSCNVMKISAGQGGRAAAWHLTFVLCSSSTSCVGVPRLWWRLQLQQQRSKESSGQVPGHGDLLMGRL